MLRLLLILCLFTLTNCDGGYKLTGTVYESQNSEKKPIDSVSINVFVGKDWLRGQTFSDSSGNFSKMGLTTPTKATYYFIFAKEGFRTDTIIKQGSKGSSEFVIEHFMIRN